MRDIDDYREEELPEYADYPPEMQEQLQTLHLALESFRGRLERCEEGDEAFRRCMGEMRQYMAQFYANDPDETVYQTFEKTNFFMQHREEFIRFEHSDVRASEAREALAVKNRDYRNSQRFVDICDSDISRETYRQTLEECKLVDFSTCRRVEMVGCGPLPKTLLFIRENSKNPDLQLWGLDRESTASGIAGDLLISLGIKNIHTKTTDGVAHDFGQADVIHVANFVSPKNEVLEQIARTAKDDAQIIVRNPVSIKKMMYEDVLHCIPPRLTVKKMTVPNPNFLYQGILLVKEKTEI